MRTQGAVAGKYASKKTREYIMENISRCITNAKLFRPLNSLITETFEAALRKAETVDLDKPLAGVPIVVKDCFSTANVRTTCGSKMLENYVPLFTATVIDKLEAAGAISLGKANLDEFCMGSTSIEGAFGPVQNPWTHLCSDVASTSKNNDFYIAGGSSGGSAVAVSCGISDIGIGSDTGGSTRNPAAFCGLVGLKPSYGLLSRHGLIPLVNSLDVPGIIARSVGEVGVALDVMSGQDPMDSTTVARPNSSIYGEDSIPDIRGLKIGVPFEYNSPGITMEVWNVWNKIANLLENEGKCSVTEMSMPHTPLSIICYHVIGECDVASNMARYDGIEYGYRDPDENRSVDQLYAANRHTGFNEVVRRRILVGNYFLLRDNYPKYLERAMKARRLISNDFEEAFNGEEAVDVLLTPVTTSDAPLYSEIKADKEGYKRERMDDYYTMPANMAGVPAISIPITLSRNGLPISLQLIAGRYQEKKLLRVAKWIERRANFKGIDIENLKSRIESPEYANE